MKKDGFISRWLLFVMVFTALVFALVAGASASIEISNIPRYQQRAILHIPLDINPNDVTISVVTGALDSYTHDANDYPIVPDSDYVDCGLDCLCMVESYFGGYPSEDDWVYFQICYIRNPDVAWSTVPRGVDLELKLYPSVPDFIQGWTGVKEGCYSPETIVDLLRNGNPVMVHRTGPDHWVVIYGYDGDENNPNWRNFKILSPTIHGGVQELHLSDLISDYGQLNIAMYRTSGILPNSKKKDMSGAKLTYIYPSKGSGVALAVNPATNNVELADWAEKATQYWSFEPQSDGSYVIKSMYNGKVLDVESGGTQQGANVQAYEPSYGYNQKWCVLEGTDGDAIVPTYAMGKRLDVLAGKFKAEQNISIYDANNSNAQKFSFQYRNDNVLPQTMSIGQEALELRPGNTAEIIPDFYPANTDTTKRGVTWTSSNASVATVSTSGVVTGVDEGTATITATSVFNPTISASRTVHVTARLDVPQITVFSVSGKTLHLEWTESPLTGEDDVRAYELYVYDVQLGRNAPYIWSATDVTGTSYDITMAGHGIYRVYVYAVNTVNGMRSDYSSRSFTIIDGDWLYTNGEPYDVTDGEIQYLIHYEDVEQAESPGEGWVRGPAHEGYVYGEIEDVETDPSPQETENRVCVGTFYFHYCDGDNTVERFRTDRFCHYHKMYNNGQFNESYYTMDGDFTVYSLTYNSGSGAGTYATCDDGPYGLSMALYYKGYRYQERTPVTTYTWSKEDTWSSSKDPNATVVSYRVRTLTFENQLYIPAGTTEIHAEAFRGDTSVEEVFIPASCTYIGSKAFADCTALKRIHIPLDTVVEADAFVGCDQLVIVRE